MNNSRLYASLEIWKDTKEKESTFFDVCVG